MAHFTVEEAHHILLSEAADKANAEFQRVAEEFDIDVSGEIFRPDPLASSKGGLCLSIDQLVSDQLSDADLEMAWNIGKDAIYDTLVELKEPFVGIILGEARKNRNYFDRFADYA